MLEGFSFESVAHYTRGLATMFFIMQVASTYSLRKRDRMTYFLFIAISYITLCYIKDAGFLFTPWIESRFMEDLVSIIDMTCAPFVCAYFYEATSPGVIKGRHLLLLYLPFAAFIPIFCIFQDILVVYAAALFTVIVGITTLALTLRNAARYGKCLNDNYSYTKDIGVRWIVQCAFVYILWFFVYSLCFSPTTWFGEAVFDIASIIFWSALCLLTQRHRVITEMMQDVSAKDDMADAGDKTLSARDAFIASALEDCMTRKKLFLNPRLTITDLAHEMGSNKSYISDYINRHGKTFYDLINEYRIAEACHIIDTKDTYSKISLSEVAARSGFNSMSSFNRYFSKIKGVSPGNYTRQKEQ